jgi:predicted dehydrogenase
LSHNLNNVLLVGAGNMALEYARVLISLNVPFTVVGRSKTSAEKFKKITNHEVITDGLDNYLKDSENIPSQAIVAVTDDQLALVTIKLITKGVKNILLEKPGGLTFSEIKEVNKKAFKCSAKVYVAYNRRFYSSTSKAKEIIKEEGGVTSFHFEFTEWSHVIKNLNKSNDVKNNWFLLNSTHVIDLAFYLGGKPKEISSFHLGGLDWHPRASVFTGSGISESGALFSYHANWEAPGRWGVEILTKKHRLILKPLESLQIQEIGSIAVNFVELQDQLDKDYKPGLYKQTKDFLNDEISNFCTIEEQVIATEYFSRMSGY